MYELIYTLTIDMNFMCVCVFVSAPNVHYISIQLSNLVVYSDYIFAILSACAGHLKQWHHLANSQLRRVI